uniref:Uncharacterized protein n=1 Tax=Meloidogyne enterolobii TaxID=390850 RepID=A0A6V7WMI7_MELEN|nr:unnamed protein product [Meloidogyne enterolobii]
MTSLTSTKTTKSTNLKFDETTDFKYLFSQSNDVQPFLRASLFDNVPPTILFYVKGTKVKKPHNYTQQLTWCNNSLLALVVRHSLLASHFKLVEEDQFWFGYWGRHLKSAQYQTLKPCQKVNHFPGAFHLGRKDRLWLHLFDMMQRFPDDEFCIMPYTYILPKDIKRLRVYLSMKAAVRHVILKPPASARGTGINIVSRFNMVPERTSLVAQHYIESPFLINDSKFDLRIYVYVTSYDPLRIYVYKEGLVRFASVSYNPEISSFTNQFMHLTNYSINKLAVSSSTSSSQTEDGGEQQFVVPKWKLTQFWKYLDKLGHNSANLKEEINKIAIKAIISCESHIRAHAAHHCKYPFISYELYGMDILVDNNLRPWLIEMNISPSLHSSTPLDIAVKAPLAKDTLILAGIPFPVSNEDEDFFSSLYFLTRNLKAHKDEEHLEKEATHLEYFNENKEIREDICDVLTGSDLRILIEYEDELARIGEFELVYPSTKLNYLKYMRLLLYSNLLLSFWQKMKIEEKLIKMKEISKLCSKKEHLAKINNNNWREEDEEENEEEK